MLITKTMTDEFKQFQNYNTVQKLFNITLFIWLLSIPAKNTFYEITTLLLPIFFIIANFQAGRIAEMKIFFTQYKDISIAFALVIVSMSISNIFSDGADFTSWASIVKFIHRYILAFFSLLYLYDKNFFTLETLAIFTISAFSVYAFHGLYQTLSSGGTQDALSIMYNRNPYALVMITGAMVTTLCFLYLDSLNSTDKSKYILLPIVFVFLLALIYCRSRSGWLAIGAFYFILAFFRKSFITKHKILIAASLLAILALFFFDERIAKRLGNLFYDKARMTHIWPYMIQLFKNHPFLGHGLVEFNQLAVGKSYYGTHNSLLEVFLYTGIIGMLAFSIPIIITVKEIIRQKKYSLLAVLAAFFTISQFNLSVFGNKTFLSTLAIFLFVIFSSRKNKNPSN